MNARRSSSTPSKASRWKRLPILPTIPWRRCELPFAGRVNICNAPYHSKILSKTSSWNIPRAHSRSKSSNYKDRRIGMITRDDIRELANFRSLEGCAVTFYYQPSTPLNKSHREEVILVKDMIRNALREAEKNGKNGSTRGDLERIGNMIDPLHGNGKAKVI